MTLRVNKTREIRVRKTLLVFITLCVLASLPAGWTKQPPPSFEVGTLSKDLLDVGCALFHRKADWTSEPIFIDNVQGIWIRINGQQMALTRVDTSLAEDWEKFVAPDVHVFIKRGREHQYEGGVSYKRVILKVTYKGQTRTIPAKASCGC